MQNKWRKYQRQFGAYIHALKQGKVNLFELVNPARGALLTILVSIGLAWLYSQLSLMVASIFIVFTIAFSGLLALCPQRRPHLVLLLFLVFSINLWARTGEFRSKRQFMVDCQRSMELRGNYELSRVVKQNRKTGRASFVFTYLGPIAERKGMKVLVSGPLELKYAKQIEASLRLEPLLGARNPGGFSRRDYARAFAAVYEARIKSTEFKLIKQVKLVGFRRQLESWVQMLITGWQEGLGQDSAALLTALFIGDKSLLSNFAREQLQTSGLGHLAAVSGLHLYFMLQPLQYLLKRWPILRPYKIILAGSIILPWFLIIGFQISLIRAGLFLLMKFIGDQAKVRQSGQSALAWVVFISLTFDPYLLRSRAFYFSVLAAWSILALAPGLGWRLSLVLPKELEDIADFLAVPIAVQALLFIPQYLSNWQVNLAGVLLNLIAAILVNLIFQFGLTYSLALVLANIFSLTLVGLLKVLIGQVLNLLIYLFERLISLGQVLPTRLSGVDKMFLIFGLASVALTYLLIRRRKALFAYFRWRIVVLKAGALVGLICFSLFFRVQLTKPELELIYLDVGQGNSSLILYAGRAIIIDGGKPDQAYYSILPCLRYKGVDRLDLAIISHGHNDHIGGIIELIKLGKVKSVAYPYREIEEANSPYNNDFWRGFMRLYPGGALASGDFIELGSAQPKLRLEVLAPSRDRSWIEQSKNDASVVIGLTYAGLNAIFTGDASKEVEAELKLDFVREGSRLLQVGHHGSNTSSSPAFLERYRPDLAIIPVGRNNYGHPSPDVLARIEGAAKIFRTDHDGAILLQCKNGIWQISCQNRPEEVNALLARSEYE